MACTLSSDSITGRLLRILLGQAGRPPGVINLSAVLGTWALYGIHVQRPSLRVAAQRLIARRLARRVRRGWFQATVRGQRYFRSF